MNFLKNYQKCLGYFGSDGSCSILKPPEKKTPLELDFRCILSSNMCCFSDFRCSLSITQRLRYLSGNSSFRIVFDSGGLLFFWWFSVRRRYFSDDFLVFSGGSRMNNSGQSNRASNFTELRDPVGYLTPVVSRFLWIFRFQRYPLDSSGFLSILLVFRTTYGLLNHWKQ